MNGAEALLRTLVNCGVDLCVGNPGTSEMHFVAALDTVPEMRAVLGLFEGAVAGMADGYGRIAGRPAVMLSHCGPGLSNALANLHNARRAHTPILSVVGDHATLHRPYDAPLGADVEGLAQTVSKSVAYVATPEAIGPATRAAYEAAMSTERGIATVILPADVSWLEGATTSAQAYARPPRAVDADELRAVTRALKLGPRCTLLAGGTVLDDAGMHALDRISQATGARVLTETFPARARRGAGIPPLRRLSFVGSHAVHQLAESDTVVLLDTRRPVSFFAYPGQPSDQLPPGAEIVALSSAEVDVRSALAELAERYPVPDGMRRSGPSHDVPADDPLTAESTASVVAAHLPDDAIFSDETITAGPAFFRALSDAAPHDWLNLTGGSIGQGVPLATGAALAAPDRPVFCVVGDGSALYTLQALWTQARERLNVVTVVLANRSYSILAYELERVGAQPGGSKARQMLDLSDPVVDFVSLAAGFGVAAVRARTAGELAGALDEGFATPGPVLIEANLLENQSSFG